MSVKNVWAAGDAYEPYVGRWSRRIAVEFLEWLRLPDGLSWLDVGCGTGALTELILESGSPATVQGIDPSEGYLGVARQRVTDDRVRFDRGDAQDLQTGPDLYGAVVSGLVLNFIPDIDRAMANMVDAAKPGGWVAAYVWDYAGRIELMRYFWDAAVELKPENRHLDEGVRFPLCQPGPLVELFERSGLQNVEVVALDVPTHFVGFDDYWSPFLGGQFPAPDYAMSLSDDDRSELRDLIRQRVSFNHDGSIDMVARAWAVRGMVAPPVTRGD